MDNMDNSLNELTGRVLSCAFRVHSVLGPGLLEGAYKACLKEELEYAGLREVRIFPLNLYVFYANPLNYVAWLWDTLLRLFFLISFKLVGKSNRLFSKKIGAVARKAATP